METLTDRQKNIENAVDNVRKYMETKFGQEYAIYYLSSRLKDALDWAPEYYAEANIDIFNEYQLEND